MRTLAWGALSFATAILVAHYALPDWCGSFAIGVLLSIALCGGYISHGKVRTGILLVCLCGALGILRYDLQREWKLVPVEGLSGETHFIVGEVTEYPEVNDEYTKVQIQLKTDGLPETKFLLYAYHTKEWTMPRLSPGDVICATVVMNDATKVYGEKTDTYIAKGIYLRGYVTDEVQLLRTGEGTLRYAPLQLSKWIQDRLDAHLSERTAPFMKALLTGERTALYENRTIYNALSGAGMTHVVAVSGMHISFVIGLILLVCGQRMGWGLAIAGVGLFSMMTGLSPSVMRAAFMQLLYLIAPVLRREADGITSVSFALGVLLLINPFAVGSVGLQMSFAAMMGMILFVPKLLDWFAAQGEAFTGRTATVYRFVTVSFSTSLGATVFTAPLCAFYFGYLSMFAPLSNLLVLWLVPYCFSGGLIVCAVSLISDTLANLIGLILSLAVEWIYLIGTWISALPFATVYLPGALFAVWFGMVYIGVAWGYRKKWRPLFPVCAVLMSLVFLAVGVKQYHSQGLTVAAVNVGQGQSIVILDGDQTAVIDCGGGYDAGEQTADWLRCHGRNTIDCLVLTHFDRDHVNGVTVLLESVPVKKLIYADAGILPITDALAEEILACAKESGAYPVPLSASSHETIGTTRLTLFISPGISENEGIIVLAQRGTFDLLITGDAGQMTEQTLVTQVGLPDGECLVVGHHGSDSSTSEMLLDAFRPEIAIISSGFNQFGHPTDEVLDRLEARNVVLYRTDQMGTIEIKVR